VMGDYICHQLHNITTASWCTHVRARTHTHTHTHSARQGGSLKRKKKKKKSAKGIVYHTIPS
jgi:hypothetical protein